MSLQERLHEIREGAKSRIPPQSLEIMHRGTEDLAGSGIMNRILKKGEKMPLFQLPDQNGALVDSAELLKKGPLVVVFYRGVW